MQSQGYPTPVVTQAWLLHQYYLYLKAYEFVLYAQSQRIV